MREGLHDAQAGFPPDGTYSRASTRTLDELGQQAGSKPATRGLRPLERRRNACDPAPSATECDPSAISPPPPPSPPSASPSPIAVGVALAAAVGVALATAVGVAEAAAVDVAVATAVGLAFAAGAVALRRFRATGHALGYVSIRELAEQVVQGLR